MRAGLPCEERLAMHQRTISDLSVALAAARAALVRKENALIEARHWIVSSGVAHPGGIVAIIDAALGAPITPETKP
jgi:hypothetical protein